jgi:hypothetical protein
MNEGSAIIEHSPQGREIMKIICSDYELGAMSVLARREARKAVEAGLRAQGFRPQSFEHRELVILTSTAAARAWPEVQRGCELMPD